MERSHISKDIFSFYSQPGTMTDPGAYAHLLSPLPCEIAQLTKMTQKLLLHIFWAKRYGIELADNRQNEVQLRLIEQKLARLAALDPAPLTEGRPLEKRLVCNCRDISTFLTAVLRFNHIPARARCGFATYFLPDHYEDHWIIEYWREDENRWVMVDGQLDELQRSVLEIPFDPLDMPSGPFLPAGQAWLMCRQGKADPDKFGIFEWHGWDFIRGNVYRDLLALNKIEVLPWDSWGLLNRQVSQLSDVELSQLDLVCKSTLAGDDAYPDIRAAHEDNPDLNVPADWLV